MRIVFIGTAGFAVPSLRALVEEGHDVALVVTQPDRQGHRMKLTPPPVKSAAVELGLDIVQPERIRESVETLRTVHPEVAVLVAYGQIIPRSVLEIPPRGVLNVHASLLPRHRGAAPIAHTILAGDRVAGVSVMQMDEQLDHGPVLLRRETEVRPGEDAQQLSERLATLGASALVEALRNLDALKPEPQDESAATYAPKLARSQGDVDWDVPAAEIDRRVRAFTPWPGVTLPWGGGRVKVLTGSAIPDDHSGSEPGSFLGRRDGGLAIATGGGTYILRSVQLPGRRPMAATALGPPP